MFHGLQFYLGQDETGKVRAYLGKDDRESNGYTNLFSNDYLTLGSVGITDERLVAGSDTAFEYSYTDNASSFPGFTPQAYMFYETPVDGSPADKSFYRERNTYFQVNFLDELKVWDGNDFVNTGGEVMTWYQQKKSVINEDQFRELVNEVTTGEGVVEGKPYYYSEVRVAGRDHWHYVMELQEGTSPTGIDNGLYLLEVQVETNIPNSIPSDPIYILYNQNLSPAPDADQKTILEAQNYLLENFGITEPAGVDKIHDFVSGKDRITLDVNVFTAIATRTGESLDGSEFAVVDNEIDVFSADATIVYNSANRTLYYNPNRIENGLGDGDRFAIFSNEVSLDADDFLVRA